MALGTTVDLGGNDLYVNNVFTGVATAGITPPTGGSGTRLDGGATSVTTATLSPASNASGTTYIFNRAAGTTVTLPAPVVGTKYTFIVGTVPTSNTDKVITDAGTTFLGGSMVVNKAGVITAYVADGSTIRSVNLNGTTTGGLTIGDSFTVVCTTATEWSIQGVVTASGTLATPFATS